jgi:hypothetical protein
MQLPELEEALRVAQQRSNEQRGSVAQVQQQIQVLAADQRNIEDQTRQLTLRRERLVADRNALDAPDEQRLVNLQAQLAQAQQQAAMAQHPQQSTAQQPAVTMMPQAQASVAPPIPQTMTSTVAQTVVTEVSMAPMMPSIPMTAPAMMSDAATIPTTPAFSTDGMVSARDQLVAKARAFKEAQDIKSKYAAPEQLSMNVEGHGEDLEKARQMAREVLSSPFTAQNLEVPAFIRKRQNMESDSTNK